MKALFIYLIFPGFLFSAVAGLMACWVDRKVSARIQWRQGPPWHQNFTDIIKLLGKEIIVPEGSSKWTFLLAPYFGFLSLILVADILGGVILFPERSFGADLIVVIYLLLIPAISLIVGASSSRNPFASIGASREMKLILSYELPFLFCVVAMIIKCGNVIQLAAILKHQANFGSNIASVSGVLAFIAAVLCMQAKLGMVPFDMAEAEQELMGGTLVEYSGPLLAVFKLTKAIMLYTLPLLFIVLFAGNSLSPWILAAKYTGILVVIILIKNTNPRLRIEQAVKFFWGPVTIIAVTALILAVFGL